jgi:hypothetical protein
LQDWRLSGATISFPEMLIEIVAREKYAMGSLTNGVTKMLGGMVAVGVCLLAAPEIAGASTACKENGGFLNCTAPVDVHYVPAPLGRFSDWQAGMQAQVAARNAQSKAQAIASQQDHYYENVLNSNCLTPYVRVRPSSTAAYPGDHYQGSSGCGTDLFRIDLKTGGRIPYGQGGGATASVRVLCPPASWPT